MSYVLPTILDLMEYANNAAAQAAFVTNDPGGYGSDVLTGGTASADSDINGAAANGCDNSEYTYWQTALAAYPHWWKYDFGAGVTKTIARVRMLQYQNYAFTTFSVQGSSNDSSWDTLYSGTYVDNQTWQTFDFANTTPYRYYRIYSTAGSVNNPAVRECEMIEAAVPLLQSYSEATIKQEGSYSLKGVATTAAVNKTLTRTVGSGSVVNLTDKTIIKFDIRASRTGSNIKIGIHDSGGTTTEITPVIAAADTWQTVVWDISAVANANKDAIDSIIITITNADAANTFYIDNMFGDGIWNFLIHRGRDRMRTAGYSLGN